VAGVACGSRHSCAWTNDGAAFCWGSNDYGQIGDGGFDDRLSPVLLDGLEPVREVVAGYAHTCAVHTDGTLSCWGLSQSGQVGNGVQPEYDEPQTVVGLE
jgi:alpha-tubulin suppressor-like RCC1 family protein